ncbi:lysine decarboxylase [Budvicia diplopodorum]|uniref:lysine decarboxylase n=1 Tax=Budvicia diplopodorum TaxID=1119056 RepID=UPI001357B721|nr:lysine decarboxylase [Budvicia diplopodorum]
MKAKIITIKDETPILTGLKKLCQRHVYSFHALPVSSHGKSDIVDDIPDLFNTCMENSATGEMFDNFFFPKGIISESQKLTSKLYNSDSSFYITGGTSVANQIAITALYKKGDCILIDKNCHQSVHFHSQSIGAQVEYLCPDLQNEDGQISAWSFNHLKNKMLAKQEDGKGYDILILTAQSYEGLIYDIPEILTRLLAAGVATRKIFIDEAWGSLNYFSNDTRPFTAMNIENLLCNYPDLEVICTHSAHKSLFCLRQASLIHCRGKDELPKKIETAKYRIHTTSPNYPILASLDISQAQMTRHGNELASYSRQLVNEFIERISQNPWLGKESVIQDISSEHWHIHSDPTKIMINVSKLGSALDINNQLIQKRIYIKRVINNNLLLNFHIGINREAVNSLISALEQLCETATTTDISEQITSDKFIIPYPPGVPIVFPGEIISYEIQKKIDELKRSGLLIIAA